MIKGMIGSNHVNVSDHQHTSVYVDMNRNLAGTVRYNGNNRELEVYDGYHWIAITNNYATISLDAISSMAIDWAIKKIKEEKERESLANEHPAIKAALENFNRAQEQLETTIHLSKNYEKQTTS